MSEREKKKRASYRRRRKIWIGALTALLALMTLFVCTCGVLLYRSNQTSYINYTETGKVDYKVGLLPNEFYDNRELGSGQAYVASLIDHITATFDYALDMDAEGVNYQYAYYVDAQLQIIDEDTKKPIYNPAYPIIPPKTLTQQSASKLTLQEQVVIDYASFNQRAKSFVESLKLTGTSSLLTVRMHIEVLSVCDKFENNTTNEYVVALTIPLTTQMVDIQMTTSVPQSESKILACESAADTSLYEDVLLYGGSADILLLVFLILLIFLTRNKDINYTLKVKRLVAAYRSFVQKLKNEFDTTGYQVLQISSFNEMLDIRDTIQSPILMHENEDMTATKFYIPTASSLVYLFEIRVEDYDEIYGIASAEEKDASVSPLPTVEEEPAAIVSEPVAELVAEPVTESVAEPVAELVAEPVAELAAEPVAEPVQEIEPATAADAAPESVIAVMAESQPTPDTEEAAEGNAYNFGVKYDYSFEARLALADDEAKEYYRTIVAFARSFGVKVSRSWARERIHLGRNLFALITFKGKKLALAFAMDPQAADPKYHAFDMSGSKKFEKTPMLMRISSARKVKYATNLLTELFTQAGIANSNASVTVDPITHRTKEELLAADLIRIEGQPRVIPVVEPAPMIEETPAEDITAEIVQDMPDDVESDYNFGPKYDYSFEANLILASEDTKSFYRQITDFARAYGVKVSRSWARERIYIGRNLFAIVTFRSRKLALALAMDPKAADPKYHAADMSGTKKYGKTPMLMRISSARKVKYATTLLEELFRAAGLKNRELSIKPATIPSKSKKKLLAEGLIRLEKA